MKSSILSILLLLSLLIAISPFKAEGQCYSCGGGQNSVILNDINNNSADADFSIAGGFHVSVLSDAYNSFAFGSELEISNSESFIIGWGGQRAFDANRNNTTVFNSFNVKSSAIIDYSLNVGTNLTIGNDFTIGRDGDITRNLQIGNNLNVGNNTFLMGKVGIETTNLTHRLNVNGNIWTNSNIYAGKIGIGTTSPEAGFHFIGASLGGILIGTQTNTAPCAPTPCNNWSTTPFAIKVTHTDNTVGGSQAETTFILDAHGAASFGNKVKIGSISTAPTAMLDIQAGGSSGMIVRTNHSIDYGYGFISKVSNNLTKAIVVQNEDANANVTEPFFVYGNGVVHLTGLYMGNNKYLDENKGIVLHDKKLFLRGFSDENHFLGFFGGAIGFAGEYPNGPVLAGWSGGILGTTNGGEKAILQWHESGKVAINGSLYADEIKILVDPLTQIPDYVFEPDYQRMPLDELENFVTNEKHLPGVASAQEVKEEGHIDMGKMQLDLLEKVEELTLYIIDLNKKIEKLEAENEQLRK